MAKKYCVYKYVKDNIPGFRDWDEFKVQCFHNRADAEKFEADLTKTEGGSVHHSGYGAGSGTIDTTFYIKEEEDNG